MHLWESLGHDSIKVEALYVGFWLLVQYTKAIWHCVYGKLFSAWVELVAAVVTKQQTVRVKGLEMPHIKTELGVRLAV